MSALRAASNLLAFMALVVTLLLVWRQSWPGRLRLFVVQSALLAVLAAVVGGLAGKYELVVVAAVFALLKVWAIPRVLGRIALGSPVRDATPGRSAAGALLVAGGLLVVAYVIMLPVTTITRLPTAGAIPLAFAMALIGLHACVTGRNAFGHVVGFLMFENGIFGVAVLATYGLPAIVEAGVFLDVLVIVLIMEGVIVQSREEHATLDVARLRELRE